MLLEDYPAGAHGSGHCFNLVMGGSIERELTEEDIEDMETN